MNCNFKHKPVQEIQSFFNKLLFFSSKLLFRRDRRYIEPRPSLKKELSKHVELTVSPQNIDITFEVLPKDLVLVVLHGPCNDLGLNHRDERSLDGAHGSQISSPLLIRSDCVGLASCNYSETYSQYWAQSAGYSCWPYVQVMFGSAAQLGSQYCCC